MALHGKLGPGAFNRDHVQTKLCKSACQKIWQLGTEVKSQQLGLHRKYVACGLGWFGLVARVACQAAEVGGDSSAPGGAVHAPGQWLPSQRPAAARLVEIWLALHEHQHWLCVVLFCSSLLLLFFGGWVGHPVCWVLGGLNEKYQGKPSIC